MTANPYRIASPGWQARRAGPAAAHRSRALACAASVAAGARHIAAAALLGATATLLYGAGHLSYDAGWALLWGKELAAGQLPTFTAMGAPTPHPLPNAVAALLVALGDDSGGALMAVSAVCFGLLTWAGYLLGARLFGRLAGVLFAAFLFTRPQLISLQGQAPIDVPFLAFLLLAAANTARRPRSHVAVLTCLAIAGLVRPEAWLFSAAYVLYVFLSDRGAPRLRIALLAAIAPCMWALFDLVITGDPMHSLHGTQELAAEVDRPRGLGTAIGRIPESFGELLGPPLTLAGLAGLLVALVILRRRAMLPASMLGLGLVSFAAIGLAGLAVIPRYLIVPVVMLGLFAVVAITGWSQLDHDDPRRRPWAAGAIVLAVMLGLTAPTVAAYDRWVVTLLHQQRAITDDLRTLAVAPELQQRHGRILHIPTRRAVPLLAAWRDLPIRAISADEPPRGTAALVIRPATTTIDAMVYSSTTPQWSAQPDRTVTWRQLYRNRSWVLYETAPRRDDVVAARAGRN